MELALGYWANARRDGGVRGVWCAADFVGDCCYANAVVSAIVTGVYAIIIS